MSLKEKMMTKEYRKAQFDKVSTAYSGYKPKLKIIKMDGETNWLDIGEDELQQIITIMLI